MYLEALMVTFQLERRRLIGIPVDCRAKHSLRARSEGMLDSDLARMYRVETKALNRAVQRNRERFPADFMFQLTPEEREILRCQIGTLRSAHGKHRKPPWKENMIDNFVLSSTRFAN